MSEPGRVVVLTTDFRPMRGGVAEYLHGIAHDLSARAPVVVMTTAQQTSVTWAHEYDLRPLPPAAERRLGLRAGDALPPIRKLRTAWYFACLRRQGARTIDEVRALPGGVQAVVIGIWDVVSHFWCESCRAAGIPYIVATYGAELIKPLYGRLPAWRRTDVQGARRVIACSAATASLARERLDLPVMPAVVHPGAGPRPPAYDIARRADDLRRELNLARGPVLLSVGRLVTRKGFDLVLRSVAALREYPALTYVIAGEGPERSGLQRLAQDLGIADRVVMVGAIDELTKWALYDVCDVFVMPNRTLGGTDWEGFGIVFAEAALAGRPAIGGRNGGAGEAIDDGRTGFLVDSEDQEALTAAMRRLLGDPELRRRLGRTAAERAATWAAASAASRFYGEFQRN